MPRHGRMTKERAKDFKGTLRQLLAAMSKYKLSLVVVIVFAVLSTIFNIAGPKILAIRKSSGRMKRNRLSMFRRSVRRSSRSIRKFRKHRENMI